MARPLTEAEITRRLSEVGGWSREGLTIRRAFTCASFPGAIALVSAVADESERMDHHPDIDIRWRTVTFILTTHSANGLTELDFELAHHIDQLADDA